MDKQKISQKQKKSTKKTAKLSGCREWDPTTELLDKNNLAAAITECLLNNDPEGIIEMIQIYLQAIERSKLAKEASLSRATLYHSLKGKNPTIRTLAKIIHALAAGESSPPHPHRPRSKYRNAA